MVPSDSKYTNYNDYDSHGVIIQELRLASRIYSIPIISITQNTRTSENASIAMSNDLIGDSYKKVRYSDYIYMIRMRSELDLLSAQVRNDVCRNDELDKNLSLTDMSGMFIQHIVPFEIKITKAKEGKKNVVQFHLFSGINLKIYSSLSDFFADLNGFKQSSSRLKNSVDLLGINCGNQLDQSKSFDINLI